MVRRRITRPNRHRALQIGEIPGWLEETDNHCLRSVAEDAYAAKAWADKYDAPFKSSCIDIYNAGMKEMARMADESLSIKARSEAGLRAMRKFWEAKVCARSRDTRRRGS